MLGGYSELLTPIDKSGEDFYKNRTDFQQTLMFEAKVYFPKRVQDEVATIVDDYAAIGKAVTQLQVPNALCSIDPVKLDHQLVDLSVKSETEMIAYARELEPELGNPSLQPDLPKR
jgi:hypothetical protein